MQLEGCELKPQGAIKNAPTTFHGRLNSKHRLVVRESTEVSYYHYLARCVSAGGRLETMGHVENGKCVREEFVFLVYTTIQQPHLSKTKTVKKICPLPLFNSLWRSRNARMRDA